MPPSTAMQVDFSRPPTAKEAERLARRLRRLDDSNFQTHLAKVRTSLASQASLRGKLHELGLRIRPNFSYRTTPIPGDHSDRKAPPRAVRPPSGKISRSQGFALRLEMTALAVAQLKRAPGNRGNLASLNIPITGDSSTIGWADLIAAAPEDRQAAGKNKGMLITSRDKRARSVRNSLRVLEEAGLVMIDPASSSRNRFENFTLLDERGTEQTGERIEYAVPTLEEETFSLPGDFIIRDWVHLLDDSEIQVLLMVACRHGAWSDNGLWVFDGATRLGRYGIHRDAYSTACKTLNWLGLIDVREVDRYDDGRAEDDDRRVNRIGLRSPGLTVSALPAMQETFRRQIERV